MMTLHAPGDLIADQYRIIAPLGHFSQSNTYVVEDLKRNALVAVKAISLQHIDDWKAVELLERQASVLSSLSHPAVPRYIRYFHCDTECDRFFYLVQELIHGDSLAHLVEQGWQFDEARVRNLALQVLEILNYLHRQTPPIVHRDIQPCNLIRRKDGRIVLVDFGSVKDICPSPKMASSTLVGTYGYMPPEQFYGKACFGSDLYSLGASLLFVLTGKSPDQLLRPDQMKIEFRQDVSISSPFAKWLEKMVEPSPKARFHSASEAIAWLKQQKNGSTQSPPAPRADASHRAVTSSPPSQPVPSPSVTQSKTTSKKKTLAKDRPRKPKPAGSRVIVRRTDGRLVIEIPPVRFDSGKGSLLDVFGRWHQLEIDVRRFSIATRRLGFHNSHQGQTKDLIKAELKGGTGYRGRGLSLLLWEGVTAHEFAADLTSVEKDWLADEINDFFDYLQVLRKLEQMLDDY